MKISIAKTAGFCMGVQRAVELALDASNSHNLPIYTYGPLIHNPQVLSLLQEKGISILDEIPEKGAGTVLIRAHGVPPDTKNSFENAGFDVIDATCPRVIKVQTIIQKHAQKGYASIIIGDKDHPEVTGLLGYAQENGIVIDRIHDLKALPAFEKAIIVAQTTQNTLFYDAVKKWASREHRHYKVFDTICDSTERRQGEAKRLAESVDAVVVVGGHNSGNTQRLAEVVREAGKPAFHIETEAELDISGLADAENIGITAGASTPNWIIKKIFRAIEALPFNKEPEWKKRLFAVQRFLLLTNLYVALGAGCLCFACTTLQGIEKPFPYIIISFLYILSMHTLNNLTGIKEARYNDPDRAAFYENNKILLTLMALISGASGLSVAAGMGMFPFILLFIMSIMGLSYNLKIIPDFVKGFKFRRIRDIPGSKTILISLAWGVVSALLPVLSESGIIQMNSMPVFIWAAAMVFIRTGFFDVLDMQGDRIVGKETIPILFGKDLTMIILNSLAITCFIVLFMSAKLGVFPKLGFLLLICPAFLFIIITAHKRGFMLPGIRLEFLTETQFIMAGIVTLVSVFI